MKNGKFLLKVRRESIPEPSDFLIQKLSCFDFFTSVGSFIEYNFSGAVNIEFPDKYSGYAHISPRGFSAFMRLLLSEIYGKNMTEVKFFTSEKEIVISISKSNSLKNRKRLVEIAERSGFSFTEESDTLILRTPLTLTQELFVFAADTLVLINYLYEAFMHE